MYGNRTVNRHDRQIGEYKILTFKEMLYLTSQKVRLVYCVSVCCYGFSISGGNFGTAKLLDHIFPFVPFLQVMGCQLNEILCKQDEVRPHTANIAIIFVGLIEVIIRINESQDLDVYKYVLFYFKKITMWKARTQISLQSVYMHACVSCVLVSACSLLFALVLFHSRSSLVVTNARKKTLCCVPNLIRILKQAFYK